ncbi:hypothetical protein FBD94_03750 [Pedobacter hiemivivus]|uniref:DNA mismatch repair proteins mutS family domain-containing protein n=1 Tax=Pedobacter hiemivivus TaxID=2530454 RepID=A0A4U1GNK2_9SPHI|nr:hypothetical protein [Pedobacter hiemivivus]TKC65664.1 hypothetical protein FBD94_03750 [Pedobacter hiemivivus]
MSFSVDKQTLDDLNILGKYQSNSIFSLFNHVKTRGGERMLEDMFKHPLSDAHQINHRSTIFQYFEKINIEFSLDPILIEGTEHFLSDSSGSKRAAFTQGIRRQALHMIGLNTEFDLFNSGLELTIQFINKLNEFLHVIRQNNFPHLNLQIEKFDELYNDKRLNKILSRKKDQQLGLIPVIQADYLIRQNYNQQIREILQFVYQLDVYICVAVVAKKKGFCYSNVPYTEQNTLSITACRHPTIPKAVANSITIDEQNNVLFLTGANMAGKSTLMKAFGINIYLAHMGFPVAAESMIFSIKDGIFSSINVPDNISMGYSHFYAEVLRVKQIAIEVSSGKNLVVIFDELFKGTNVKDAYDATLAVTSAFSKYHSCSFIISTHIIEVGQMLQQNSQNIQFKYLPTIMEGTVPRYTYELQSGITEDRQGMIIIDNEKIIDILVETAKIGSK